MSTAPPSRLRARVALPGRRVEVNHPAPSGPVRLEALLPFMYAVDEAVVEAAVGQARKQGQTVSCRKGCAACCKRQPVPVTPPEAHALARRVAALPAAQRERVSQRFAQAEARLQEAGLYALFMRDTALDDPQQARAAAQDYMALGLVCPFLENEACSIHAQRPFVCRQYLVSSPPALCADPLGQPVAVLPMPSRPAKALLGLMNGAAVGGEAPALTVPLVLALAHARRHEGHPPLSPDARHSLALWLQALVDA